MDDPDVPQEVREDRLFTHWICFNISPDTQDISEGEQVGILGANTHGNARYTGPCPPVGYIPNEHRYFFRLYALDVILDFEGGASREKIEVAMKSHIIAQAQIIGLYKQPQ